MLEQAQRASDRALDLRTTLKVQSVVLALAHSVFTTPELVRKAILFKHGRVLLSTVSSDKLNANKIVPVSE